MKIDVPSAVVILKELDNIQILMHRNPDGDTIGCAFALWAALSSLNKTVSIGCCDAIPGMYNYLSEYYENNKSSFIPSNIVSVDSGSRSQLGSIIDADTEIILSIDHHGSNTLYAANNVVEAAYASCAEIVYEIILKLYVEIDSYIGSAIYTGVSTDTGCFKYRNTTSNAHIVAAELLKSGMNLGFLNRVLFESKTKEFLKLQQMALSSLKFYYDDKIAVTTVTREMFIISGASDEDMTNISPISRAIEGVEVGLTFRQTPKGTIKCSVRSSPLVDASEVCRLFGGGGHHGSAAFECSGDMGDIQAKTIATVIEFLQPK